MSDNQMRQRAGGWGPWSKVTIPTRSGPQEAIAPLILSVSRATDVPAFYMPWFIKRLEEGYVRWVNPFNGKNQYVSLSRLRAVVFWSKNPRSLLENLDKLSKYDFSFYVQYTLNDYVSEGLEPMVPDIGSRIDTFVNLAAHLGRERVVWRFDPLILAGGLKPEDLLEKIRLVGDAVRGHTEKLVFSFADIDNYRNVRARLEKERLSYRNFTAAEMDFMAREIASLCAGWGITAATCGEKVDLAAHGIAHNRCIDDELILRISSGDRRLGAFLRGDVSGQLDLFSPSGAKALTSLKDKGQREACGCVWSKDIGAYDTCCHLCTYCYANSSPEAVTRNRKSIKEDNDALVG